MARIELHKPADAAAATQTAAHGLPPPSPSIQNPKSKPENAASAAAAQFLLYLEMELGLSPNTLDAYARDLRDFSGFCELVGVAITHADTPALAKYLQHLQTEKKLATTSILRHTASLKMFFRFAVARGYSPLDPTKLLEPPRIWKKLPDVLGREQITALLSAAGSEETNRLAARDRAIMELFYASGLRASELAELSLEDLHFDLGVIRILGKGQKERIVPLGQHAIAAVNEYVQNLRPLLVAVKTTRKKAGHSRLFLTRSGGPMTRIVLWQLVQKFSTRAGLRKIHPHTLRHTFATHLLSGGADLRIVQELLGHSNVTTTQIYTHVDSDRLKQVHKKHHPRQ